MNAGLHLCIDPGGREMASRTRLAGGHYGDDLVGLAAEPGRGAEVVESASDEIGARHVAIDAAVETSARRRATNCHTACLSVRVRPFRTVRPMSGMGRAELAGTPARATRKAAAIDPRWVMVLRRQRRRR